MFENPLIFVAALVLLAVLLLLRKREKGKNSDQDTAEVPVKKQSPQGKVARKTKNTPAPKQVDTDVQDDQKIAVEENVEKFELEESWASTQEVEVSVEQVDDLSEYEVYKQFGYYDQAAQSLNSYLTNRDERPKELVVELCGLYLEAGEMTGFVDALEAYCSSFDRVELEEITLMGFEVDADDLGLRVFAEDKLGWGIDEIEQKIARDEDIESIPVLEEPVEEVVQSSFKGDKTEVRGYTPETALDLVEGFARVSDLNMEEKVAVLSFSANEKTIRMAAPGLDYATASNILRRSLGQAKRPANILMDVLTLDFCYRNLDNYAHNLWSLYYHLGQYGRIVKEKMLGWGYLLGSHPVFAELEGASAEYQVRDIGIRFGYIEESASQLKGRMLPLIEEVSEAESGGAISETGEVLQEAEAQLSYGQVDEAMTTLEAGIFADSTESQLYSMLFDLYERSEAWSRFETFSTQIRAQGSELPEEVKVMFSRLAQQMNKGGRS